MKKETRYRLEAAAAALVSGLLAWLPRRPALALGSGLGRLWAALDPRHVAIAADNLQRAFPEWEAARTRRTAREVYRHFARILIDLLWLQRRDRETILSLVSVEGREHLEAAMAEGRGGMLVTAHFGNWELHGLAHAWLFAPIAVVARPLDNPSLDRRLCALRARPGNQVIPKRRALASMLRTLRQGGGVAVLIDQNVQEKDGIFVEFFGRPAATTTVAAALAIKTGSALLPSRAIMQPDGRYRLVYEPALRWLPSGDRNRDIAELTQRLTSVIEAWVREAPEQWLWIHRRWKTQP